MVLTRGYRNQSIHRQILDTCGTGNQLEKSRLFNEWFTETIGYPNQKQTNKQNPTQHHTQTSLTGGLRPECERQNQNILEDNIKHRKYFHDLNAGTDFLKQEITNYKEENGKFDCIIIKICSQSTA